MMAILTVVLLFGQTAAGDLKLMQGKWVVATEEHGGVKTPAKKLKALSVEVKNNTLYTREGTTVREEATITLDAAKKPGFIDLKITAGQDRNKQAKGIYKIDGDTLTICMAEPDKDRPTDFAGKEKTGHTLIVLKRAKK